MRRVFHWATFWWVATFGFLPSNATAHENQSFVTVAPDKLGFVVAASGKPFVPWGFNYDHDEAGRLIEDYWHDEWPKVEQDFREMKELGANVARIHLQLGRFMSSADQPDERNLRQLARLLRLAEKIDIYLDLTGLGCYHKQDAPPWYDALGEAARWRVQALFWQAVAGVCADRPAVFCYDLMNEPVVPGGDGKRDDWLGGAFGDKHFVQFIALETRGRERPQIAREWIETLVKAIRQHDRRHLVTVGLVPWSLDRPGLSSGFVPEKIAEPLDFLAVHIYPEAGKVEEALKTLRGFGVGKPVVIEEMFPLKCRPAELRQFVLDCEGRVAGWIGFYWGKTPEECRKSGTIGDAMCADWLDLFVELARGRQ
ncbi:MAG: cellulase family glycosylhydrolase [Pirellulales bacterium]|nr:cellulase family glycosylhydrolase [Pirellulales bacterium]